MKNEKKKSTSCEQIRCIIMNNQERRQGEKLTKKVHMHIAQVKKIVNCQSRAE